MSLPTETKQYVLAEKPLSSVDVSKVFKLITHPIPELKDNQVLLQTTHLSNDPAQRGWISPQRSPERLYVPPVQIDEVMRARAIGKVVASKCERFKVGDSVAATSGWTAYAVVDGKDCQPLQAIPGVSTTQYLGSFGATGITAMYGLDVGECKASDKIAVISGAAGATGSMAVQIAKHIIGVKKVVGIAGSDDKCRWVESLGADVCLNYKAADFKDEVKKHTDGWVDVYFDNVGGEILDLMLTRMGQGGRVIACGAVSAYMDPTKGVIRNWTEIITMRIQIRGFIVMDAAARFGEYTQKLVKGYKDGHIKITGDNETIVPTKFEDIPKTWLGLFEGANTGKLITQLE